MSKNATAKSKVKSIDPKTVTLSDLQYERIRECLVECRCRLEGVIQGCKTHDPHKAVVMVVDALKDTAKDIQYSLLSGCLRWLLL